MESGAVTCPKCLLCNWTVYRHPVNPYEDKFTCKECGTKWTREKPKPIVLSVAKDFKPEIPGSMLEILKLTYRDVRMLHAALIKVAELMNERGSTEMAKGHFDLAARFGPLFDLFGPVETESK